MDVFPSVMMLPLMSFTASSKDRNSGSATQHVTHDYSQNISTRYTPQHPKEPVTQQLDPTLPSTTVRLHAELFNVQCCSSAGLSLPLHQLTARPSSLF